MKKTSKDILVFVGYGLKTQALIGFTNQFNNHLYSYFRSIPNNMSFQFQTFYDEEILIYVLATFILNVCFDKTTVV